MPRVRRLRPSLGNRYSDKKLKRPRARIANITAAVVVALAILSLSRASSFTSQYNFLSEHPPANRSRTRPHLSSTPSNSTMSEEKRSKQKPFRNPSNSHGTLSMPNVQRVPNPSLLTNANYTPIISSDGTILLANAKEFTITETTQTRQHNLSGFDHLAGTHEANIAFFCQISDNNIPFLPRLLSTLWHPKNIYLIHFDIKIPLHKTSSFRESIRKIAKFSNVHFMVPEQITYMGVSMLLNTLSSIEQLLSISKEWDYFINISGSDYPLVHVSHMRLILGQPQVLDKNRTFLQIATSKKFWGQMKRSRFDYVSFDTALGMEKNAPHELVRTYRTHPLKNRTGVEFVQAEAWNILHRSFGAFCIQSSFARKLLLLLSNMQDPEEHFFPMAAWNDPYFNSTLSHNALRAIFWHSQNGTASGQHPFYVDDMVHDVHSSYWTHWIESSKSFFMRKFRDPSSHVLDDIDKLKSGIHVDANMTRVRRSLTICRQYVNCLSNRDALSNKVTWHPPCKYS